MYTQEFLSSLEEDLKNSLFELAKSDEKGEIMYRESYLSISQVSFVKIIKNDALYKLTMDSGVTTRYRRVLDQDLSTLLSKKRK